MSVQLDKTHLARTYTPGRHFNVNQGELDLLDVLRKQGIYAEPGRITGWKYIDVVAWGCVCIETKYSNEEVTEEFHWRVSGRNKSVRGHLIVLVCIYPSGIRTHHVFSSLDPVFYNNEGQLKKGINYQPNASRRRPGVVSAVLTPDLMEEHRAAWHLIEEIRLEIADNLRR